MFYCYLIERVTCNVSCFFFFFFFFFLITWIYFQGSDGIQCILLDMSKITKFIVCEQTFKRMENLRMLKLYYSCSGHLLKSKVSASNFASLPDTLKILYWNGFPRRSLPPTFCPQNIVRLEMAGCHLKQLWEVDQVFQVIPLCFRLVRIKINSTTMFSVFYIIGFHRQFLYALST